MSAVRLVGLPWSAPVVPVVSVGSAAEGVAVARALHAGGIDAIEVVLRTPAALEAVRAIRAEVEGISVGVGSIASSTHVEAAVRAGARFLVTPGASDRLLDALTDSGLPCLPGTATPSDMIRVIERGIGMAKLFPAAVLGGVDLLRAIAGPLPQLRFCPTGGISEADAPAYLALDNVLCVGGSWLTPAQAIASGDWDRIAALARAAAALRPAGQAPAQS